MSENNNLLDKTAFAAQSYEQADDHTSYWKTKTPGERLEAGFKLINQVYGTTNQTPLDRPVFSMRKHKC